MCRLRGGYCASGRVGGQRVAAVSMYDPSLQWAVLRLLERWGRLPLSDVLALLDPLQRPLFREDLIKDMAWDGLIALQSAGDEQVLELTPRGRAALDEQRRPAAPPPPPRES